MCVLSSISRFFASLRMTGFLGFVQNGSALEIDIKCSIFALKIGGPLRKGIDYRAFSLIGECSTILMTGCVFPGV